MLKALKLQRNGTRKMAKEVAGGKAYKGSKQNGGRKIVVIHYKDSSGTQ